MQRLVLLDIDGTLLWPDNAGRAAMKAAMDAVYGLVGGIDHYGFGGFTDRHNVFHLMREAGLPEETIEAGFDRLPAIMAREMRARLERGEHHIRPYTDARELVQALHAHDQVLPGLLTGNFEPTARIKLEYAGIDPGIFRVGAYGHESASRSDLPALAVQRAERLSGQRFRGQEIVIIGDTPHDITCGQGVGARSIAVLTGWSKREEIESYHPHYLFEDLSDLDAVMAAILAPLS